MRRGRFAAFAGLLAGVPRFVGRPIDLDQARHLVADQLDHREPNFLRHVRDAVFDHPSSPYLPLLRRAQCEYPDLERSVTSIGIEATLVQLRDAGVYVSFDEFKGRQPIVRDGVELDVSHGSFDNPRIGSGIRVTSGGSTGPGTPVWMNLSYLETRAATMMIGFEMHGVLGAPTAGLRETLPAPTINLLLEDAHVGQLHERWFAPSLDKEPFSSLRNRSVTRLLIAAGRAGGTRLPLPEPIDADAPVALLDWIETRLHERGACTVRTGISYALRVCRSAHERGLDLSGVTFVGAGEPVTEGKVAPLRRSGARWVSNYSISEVGRVGIACGAPSDVSDVHLLKHTVALVLYPRTVPGSNASVESFHYTSLRMEAPKVLLNVESDDHGVVEERPCGCALERLGFGEHIRDIYSFRKLTGEGVSVLGTDALRVIDDVLPSAFGGSPSDYQFVEEEDAEGRTKVTLVVRPSIELPTDVDVVRTVLDGLAATKSGRAAGVIWQDSDTLRVRRGDPETTGRGKLRPLVPKPRQS